ncbi:hypothetical protein [Christiangramia echinicola]|uniref:hypothetical protein n=1 Tax=Christiangramia echinicola TaxID=279359 RepID=UPI00041683BF|nr:hypothetical protein [Christiangramia echinicola]
MKHIIKNFKIVAIALLALGVSSCDEILDDDLTDFGTGPNFVGFSAASVTAPFAVGAEPQTYEYNVPIFLDGPSAEFESGEIVVTFELDPASTAQQGLNYDFTAGNTVTLNSSNDFSANIPVTVYTEGVSPPTVESLILNITDISTSGTSTPVVANEKSESTTVNLSYICETDLSGDYLMNSGVRDGRVQDFPVTISANDEGGWDVSNLDGGALESTGNGSLSAAGSIIVVCGEVQTQTAANYCDALGIGCITSGTWDEEAGVLTIQYNDSYFGFGDYTATYTRIE